MFPCTQLTFAHSTHHAHAHSHPFSNRSSVFNVSRGQYLNHAQPLSSTTSFVSTNVPRHRLHSHHTSVELRRSATSHSQLKAERVLQTWHGHFVLVLVTIFILIYFPIIVLHYHTTGGPVPRLWSASPANVPL